MDLNEASELKERLEDKIEVLIRDFEQTTRLTVEELHLERSDFSTKDNPNYEPLQYVLTKVVL